MGDGAKGQTATGLQWLHSRQLEQEVEWAARVDTPVMISGEPGVGKHFVAHAIHQRSDRRGAPVVRIRTANGVRQHEADGTSDAPQLVSTGQDDRVLRMAHGATVVLEGIDRLARSFQFALERFLEGPTATEARSLGGLDVRLVSMLNAHAGNGHRPESLSERLFYRLNVIHLVIPPLRQRRNDIPDLLAHWLTDCEQRGLGRPTISREALDRLTGHSWPENMRELKAVVECLAQRKGGRRVSAADVHWVLTQSSDGNQSEEAAHV